MAVPAMNNRTAKLTLLDLRLLFSQSPKRLDGALFSPDYILCHGNRLPAPFPEILRRWNAGHRRMNRAMQLWID